MLECKENKEGNILKGFMGSVVATIRVDKKGVTRSFSSLSSQYAFSNAWRSVFLSCIIDLL